MYILNVYIYVVRAMSSIRPVLPLVRFLKTEKHEILSKKLGKGIDESVASQDVRVVLPNPLQFY